MTKRGVPAVAILASSVVGFLCVIAAAISPDTVFAFLLNSSGAIILFVYLLIGISQIVLRYRNGSEQLKVKMWLFPVLSILTVWHPGDAGADGHAERLPLAVAPEPAVVGAGDRALPGATSGSSPAAPRWRAPLATDKPHRVLVLANQTANSEELLNELRRIGADSAATYYVVVPASPIETGVAATHGPLDVMEATQQAAQAAAGPHPGRRCVRRTSTPTAHWATTGRCGRWPTRSTRSTRIRS